MLNLPLENDPFKIEQFEKGIEAIQNGDPRKAIRHLTTAITIEDNNAILYLHRGSCHKDLNNYLLARHDLEKGIQMIKVFMRENRDVGVETQDACMLQIIQALVMLAHMAKDEQRYSDAFNDYTEAIGFNYLMIHEDDLPAELKKCNLFMRRSQIQAFLNRMTQASKDMGYALAEASGTSKNAILQIAQKTGRWNEIEVAYNTFSKIFPPDRWDYIRRNIN